MFKIYERSTYEGRAYLGKCDHQTAELIRQGFSNVEFEDVETSTSEIAGSMPSDEELSLIYGVRDQSALFSAIIVSACIVLGAMIMVAALINQ